MFPLEVLGAVFLSCVSRMQEEALEKISSQIGNGKYSAPDGGDLCKKISLRVKALIMIRQ